MKKIFLFILFIFCNPSQAIEILIFDQAWEAPGECQLGASAKSHLLPTRLTCYAEKFDLDVYLNSDCNEQFFIDAMNEEGESITSQVIEKDVRYTEYTLKDRNKGSPIYVRVIRDSEHCLVAVSPNKAVIENHLHGLWRDSGV